MKIATNRLLLYPISDDAMRQMIAAEPDAEMKQAYTEMLQGCIDEPQNRQWYAVWLMDLKSQPGKIAGDFCFKGLQPGGVVEIGYGLRDGCCGKGYMTEAVKAITTWAFAQPSITRVEAETTPENAASQKVLAACGFVPTGTMGEEGPRFAKSSI